MFENETMTAMTTENEAAVEETATVTKKHRGRVAKPALTLTDVLDKFDNGEVNAFAAEWGTGKTKTKAIMMKIDGVPTAMYPANAGESYTKQDYTKTRDTLSIIDGAYPVSVKVI